jgi:hypothetical protein
MNKFLELSFINHIRNNDDLITPYENCFNPIMEFVRERLSEKACDELQELLADCYTEGLHIAGVLGMGLAIGVTNGTIKQVIE